MSRGREWYIDAFGAPLADVRAKLIDEAWFGRKTSEPARSSDLGWMRGEQSWPAQRPEHTPDHSRNPFSDHARDTDRGIDR